MNLSTQVDIARLSWVTKATVSHVVNHKTGCRVPIPKKTRQRALDAIVQLDCRPNTHAQTFYSIFFSNILLENKNSQATARNDLTALPRQRLLTRIHREAILTQQNQFQNPPFIQRHQ